MENEQQQRSASTSEISEGPPAIESLASIVLHRWQEEDRLTRFFTKLVGEVTFLGADRVEFRLEGDSVSGAISRESNPVKKMNVKGVWFEPMFSWLVRRKNPLVAQEVLSTGNAPTPDSYPVAIRTGEVLVCCSVERRENLGKVKSIILRNFTTMNWSQAIDALGVMPYSTHSFDELFKSKSGTILAIVPSGRDLNTSVAPFLVFGAGGYAGDFSDPGVRAALPLIAKDNQAVVSITADEPSEVLLALRGYGIDLKQINLRGISSLAFARRVCPGCAKKANLDPTTLQGLPDYFQSFKWEKYAVGRGCDSCGHLGYRGVIGLQSVIEVNDALISAFRSGAGQVDLIELLTARGLKPLLEDGFRKALEGLTTIEAINSVCKQVPTVYLENWKREVAAQKAHGGVIAKAIEDAQAPAVPRSPHYPDDSRLFSKAVLRKRREKPLVLVVEDDVDQRSILEMVLKGAEYDTATASNGAEALEAIEKMGPDLIISDLMMPVMDGSELVSRLKKEVKFSRVPILMLTMVADEEREYALLDLGADDYCEKTIQRKVLLKRVENLLKRSGAID